MAIYSLLDDNLVLKDLDINLGIPQENGDLLPSDGPELNGIKPQQEPEYRINNSYKNINLPINLTGGILIAKDFIQELYIHMGFHPAWKYEKVHELLFQEGKLTEKRDVSGKLREVREKLANEPLKPGIQQMDQLEWIESTFRLDYEF